MRIFIAEIAFDKRVHIVDYDTGVSLCGLVEKDGKHWQTTWASQDCEVCRKAFYNNKPKEKQCP